jgi:dipeptidase E
MFGCDYLEHAMSAIDDFLGDRRTVHFAPYALRDYDAYATRVQAALQPLGVSIVGLHMMNDPGKALEHAAVLFAGGGNSFRLLKNLQQLDLVARVRRLVESKALSYMGSSAGTNMACPSLRTTNDMPIVQPLSFGAFGLLRFQINPHYLDPDPSSKHMGETREQRIKEFLEDNDVPVLGLREGAWLRRRDRQLLLDGRAGARLFRRGRQPEEFEPGSDLSWLLDLPAHFDRA